MGLSTNKRIGFVAQEDEKVLPEQAQRMDDVYAEHALVHELHLVEGAGHRMADLDSSENRTRAIAFLEKHMKCQS